MSSSGINRRLGANDEKKEIPNPEDEQKPSIADFLDGEGPVAAVPQSDTQDRGSRHQFDLDFSSGQMVGELPVEDNPAEQQEAKSSAPAPTDNKPAEGEEVKSSPEAEDDSGPAPRSPR